VRGFFMSESEVRKLRDTVYGHSSDAGWEACKENWMRPDSVEWLKKEAAKIESFFNARRPMTDWERRATEEYFKSHYPTPPNHESKDGK